MASLGEEFMASPPRINLFLKALGGDDRPVVELGALIEAPAQIETLC